ncbi:MAG: hypothetical protein G01um101416_775 [Microgenomates group bacterium Gr01-1014_16]|nr:MAG: hypothetical protein G01um101416_775 [Microgenomates group bacterium Gr01-1014_16]
MTRTQIYLPDDTHAQLLQIAQTGDQSLSQLIREGADMIIKAKSEGLTPTQKFVKAILSFPDSKRVKLSKSAVELIRDERD